MSKYPSPFLRTATATLCGALLSVLIFLILAAGAALFLFFGDFSVRTAEQLALPMLAFSAFCGGIAGGRMASAHGLRHGVFVALLLLVLLLPLFLSRGEGSWLRLLLRALCLLPAAAAGGILGLRRKT